jgi:sulfite reductase beta subunit-like hemoprotein
MSRANKMAITAIAANLPINFLPVLTATVGTNNSHHNRRNRDQRDIDILEAAYAKRQRKAAKLNATVKKGTTNEN